MNETGWLMQTLDVLKFLLPGGVLTAWCLWGVNWRKAWPILEVGGWIPFALIAWMTAYVWSLIYPRSITVAGVTVGNYSWQLVAVALLGGWVLFCGWLQCVYSWEPESISLDPPADAGHHDSHHGHH